MNSWDRFTALRSSVTKRETDGRLKLKASKMTHHDLVILWAKLTGIHELSRKQLIEAIEQYVNETDEELFLEELSAKDGAIDLRVKANPELIATLAEQMSATLEEQGAANYCEWQFQSGKTGKGYTLLVQRKSGKTPAQKHNEIKARLQDIITTWSGVQPRATISKNQAAKVLSVVMEGLE